MLFKQTIILFETVKMHMHVFARGWIMICHYHKNPILSQLSGSIFQELICSPLGCYCIAHTFCLLQSHLCSSSALLSISVLWWLKPNCTRATWDHICSLTFYLYFQFILCGIIYRRLYRGECRLWTGTHTHSNHCIVLHGAGNLTSQFRAHINKDRSCTQITPPNLFVWWMF